MNILLESNLSALSLNLSLDLLSLFLGSVLLDHLRSTIYKVLSFLEAKSGDLANNLDNLNLVLTNLGKLYVKLSLLLFCCS